MASGDSAWVTVEISVRVDIEKKVTPDALAALTPTAARPDTRGGGMVRVGAGSRRWLPLSGGCRQRKGAPNIVSDGECETSP